MQVPMCITHTKLDFQYSFYMYVIPYIFNTILYSFYVYIHIYPWKYLCVSLTQNSIFNTLSIYMLFHIQNVIGLTDTQSER